MVVEFTHIEFVGLDKENLKQKHCRGKVTLGFQIYHYKNNRVLFEW